jgi:hypothetical protein
MPRKRNVKTPIQLLTVSIHGKGVDIEARFSDSRLSDVIADAVRRTTTGPIAPPSAAAIGEHDFDIVRRVIQLAEPKVLQAIVDLAKHELETRQNAS